MSIVHRTLAGGWTLCADTACDLLFHLPDLTVAEAQQLPQEILLPLLNTVQPPTKIDKRGAQVWQVPVKMGRKMLMQSHRDYDLPAIIYPDGSMEWRQGGRWHRDGDQPAIIWADGGREWYQGNALHRDSGLPAAIWPDGQAEWYEHGKFIKRAGI